MTLAVDVNLSSGPRLRCLGCGHLVPIADVTVFERRRWMLCPACGAMSTWELDVLGDDVVDLRRPAGTDGDSEAVLRFIEAVRETIALTASATDVIDQQWDGLDDAARRELVTVAARGGAQLSTAFVPLLATFLRARVPFGTPSAVGSRPG